MIYGGSREGNELVIKEPGSWTHGDSDNTPYLLFHTAKWCRIYRVWHESGAKYTSVQAPVGIVAPQNTTLWPPTVDMFAGCATHSAWQLTAKALPRRELHPIDQHVLTVGLRSCFWGGHSFVSLFFFWKSERHRFKIYVFLEKMLGIHFAGCAIQFNNFNKWFIRSYIKWATFFKICGKNVIAKHILVTTSFQRETWDSTSWEPLH